jgi:hypothetical protein
VSPGVRTKHIDLTMKSIIKSKRVMSFVRIPVTRSTDGRYNSLGPIISFLYCHNLPTVSFVIAIMRITTVIIVSIMIVSIMIPEYRPGDS